MIRCLIGSQCSLYRTGRICSDCFVLVISLAAVFWIRWSFETWWSGRPYKTELQWSSLDVTYAWTRRAVSDSPMYFRILLIFRMAMEVDMQILFTWRLSRRWLSRTTPRLHVSVQGGMSIPLRLTDSCSWSCCLKQDVKWRISVFLWLQTSLLSLIHFVTSFKQCWRDDRWSALLDELSEIYSWVSSAYSIQSMPCARMTSSTGAK